MSNKNQTNNLQFLTALLSPLLDPNQHHFSITQDQEEIINNLPKLNHYKKGNPIQEFTFDPENGLITYLNPHNKTYKEQTSIEPILSLPRMGIMVYPMI